jgi:small subunit ribosomal protein S2
VGLGFAARDSHGGISHHASADRFYIGIHFVDLVADRLQAHKEMTMANELVGKLIEAGAHFGHRVSRWNPKMAPYIYGRKNLIHIIDIRETLRGMLRAKKYLSQVAQGGSLVLFVGTKRQASEVIQREATRCGMPFVSERWLGGCLTNFRTIRDRMGRLEELETIMNSDQINGYSKKMQSALNREYRKIYRNLNGLRTLNRIPECLVIIDPKKEKNAIREAKALGVTTVALIDTDCDPSQVDLVIPGNDDGIRSIDLIVKQLADAVLAGKSDNPELMKTVPQASADAAAKDAVSEMAALAEKEALD